MEAYEEAEEEEDENRMEEIVDEAKEKLREEIYDDWYDGLEDPIEFLVNEQGLYSVEDALKQSFIQVDYEKLADELEYDFTFIDGDGLYVFSNNYAKGGKVRSKRSIKTDRARISQEPWEQAYKPKRKGNYYAKGGSVDEVIMIKIGGDKKYPYYIKKIDTTHISMANNKDGVDLVVPSHILQHKGESYYDDVRSWLKGGASPNGKSYDSDYYAKGGKTDWVDKVVDSPNFDKGSFSAKAEKRGMSS